jgi:HSP20 family protein
MKTILKRNQLPVFFDDFLGDVFNTNKMSFKTAFASTTPAINIKESDTVYQIELAAPGMEKSDFKISIDQDLLSISTEKPEEKTENAEKYNRKEFGYLLFKRSFTLAELKIETEKIEAKYEAGVLIITVPKKVEQENKTVKAIVVE